MSGGVTTGKLDVDIDGMALISPYLSLVFVERIPLFVIRPDDLFQHLPIEGIFFPHALYELFHIGPAVLVEADPCRPVYAATRG